MIGFAGQRVIEQITKQKLPEGFQTAEFLCEHGMVDIIVPRLELRAKLGQLLALYQRTDDSAGETAGTGEQHLGAAMATRSDGRHAE